MSRSDAPSRAQAGSTRRRLASLLTLAVGILALPGVPGCGALQQLSRVAVPECRFDARSPARVSDFDFEGELGLPEESAERLESAMLGMIEVRDFATSLERDLFEVCTTIGRDLDAPPRAAGATADAGEACQAAASALGHLQLPAAALSVELGLPECQLDGALLWSCAKECDEDFEGPIPVPPPCEDDLLKGSCQGTCEGKCQAAAAQACTGTCWGACDQGFLGACAGRCQGTCNGKAIDGSCRGRCQGSCDGDAAGRCTGACQGECELRKGGRCQATCEGKCQGAWQGASCLTGPLPPPMSPECEVKCFAKASKELRCSSPRVRVTHEGGAPDSVVRLASNLEKDLPRLLTLITGRGLQAARLAGGVQGSVKAIQQQFTAAANSLGDPLKAGRLVAQLTTCVLPAFTETVDRTLRLPGLLTSATQLAASAADLGKPGKSGDHRQFGQLSRRFAAATPKPAVSAGAGEGKR